MGGKVFHKISLGTEGLASHQGMSERHWTGEAMFTIR